LIGGDLAGRGEGHDALSARTIARELRDAAPTSVPAMRELRRRWSRQLRGLRGPEVVRLALRVHDLPDRWARLVAYELISSHRDGIPSLTPAVIGRMSRGLEDWGTVDAFACLVAGPAWREGRIPARVVQTWVRSPDRWRRRAAVVSTVALNVRARGGRGDVARTLAICRQLVADRDDMVVKAVSWSLRSLVPVDRNAVSSFLARHRPELAARVLREVDAKLRTGRKSPVRRG
jgi:3-methyladenine DNA glycosylase AlkD